MSKRNKILAVIGVIGVIVIIGAIIISLKIKVPRLPDGQESSKLKDPAQEKNIDKNNIESVEYVVYEDESGFIFEYPSNYEVEDLTEEAGEEYYTRLEIGESRGDQNDQGKIIIEIKDTKYKSVEEWFKKDKEAPKEAELAGAVQLDEIEAGQYKSEDKLYTAAIDQGALYLIKGGAQEGAKEVYERVVLSFAFVTVQKPAESGGGVIYEEEEIIE